MKNTLLVLIFSTLAIAGFGQTSLSPAKFFYDLPIDSCSQPIISAIKSKNLGNSRFPNENQYRINNDLYENNSNLDSIVLNVNCFQVAIGGSPNQVSPMVYEQWLTQTAYFNNRSSAEMIFKGLKSELDTFDEKPYFNTKSNEIEWVYWFGSNVESVQSRQIHLAYDAESIKVKISYRIIFYENTCSCD